MGTFNPLTELRLWREAFAGLSENALALRWRATLPLVSQRTDTAAAGLSSLAAVLAVVCLLLLFGYAADMFGIGEASLMFELTAVLNYSLFMPAVLLWFFAALFACSRQCLAFLAGSAAAGKDSIDDMLLITAIDRRELIAALLAACLRRMAAPLLLLCLCLSFSVAEIIYDGYGLPSSWGFRESQLGSALLNYPIILICLLAGSGLSFVVYCLLLLLLGRGLYSPVVLNVAAAYCTLAQLGWLFACFGMLIDLSQQSAGNSGIEQLFRHSSPWLNFGLALLVLLSCAAYLLLLADASLRRRGRGASLLFLSPLLAILLGLGGLMLVNEYIPAGGHFALNLLWSLNLCSLPAALLYPHNLFTAWSAGTGNLYLFPMMEFWRVPLMLFVQLLLALALGRIALAACEPRSRFE